MPGAKKDEKSHPDSKATETMLDEPDTADEPLLDDQADITEPVPAKQRPKLEGKKKVLVIGAALVLVLAAVFGLIKPLRLAVMNLLTSAQVQVLVIDQETKQPISDVEVSLGGQAKALQAKTDSGGQATFNNVSFGHIDLTFKKEAYETTTGSYEVTKRQTILDAAALKPTGTPVSLTAEDQIAGTPVKNFTVLIKGTNASAPSNAQGVATVNVPESSAADVTLVIKAEGFNDKEIKTAIKQDAAPITASLIKAGRHYFLSNRDGEVTIYSSNFDGTEAKRLVKPTGEEKDASTIFGISPDLRYGVWVASRTEKKLNGEPASGLYIVDLATGKLRLGDDGASSYQIIKITNDAAYYTISYQNPDKYVNNNMKLKKVNLATGQLTTIDNGYSLVLNGQRGPWFVYEREQERTYTLTGYYRTLFIYNADTGNRQSVIDTKGDTQTGSKYFIDDHKLAVLKVTYSYPSPTKEQWYTYTIGGTLKAVSSKPKVTNKVISLSPNSKRGAYIERRDSKSRLILTDANGKNEKMLNIEPQVDAIYRWVDDDTLIFTGRIGDVYADYIVDANAGNALKITNTYTEYYYSGAS